MTRRIAVRSSIRRNNDVRADHLHQCQLVIVLRVTDDKYFHRCIRLTFPIPCGYFVRVFLEMLARMFNFPLK